MSERVILLGGGCHAKVVIDCIHAAGDTVVGILDDNLPIGHYVLGIPVLGAIDDYAKYIDCKFIIAIGKNHIRHRIADKPDVKWYTAVHPGAIVSANARIGEGSVIMPRVVINSNASIGNHCIINTGAIIEHDDCISDYVHISPGVCLGGTVNVGEETHVGIGAVVKNNTDICGGCTVGAGAVVVKNITESGIYVGVPAYKK